MQLGRVWRIRLIGGGKLWPGSPSPGKASPASRSALPPAGTGELGFEPRQADPESTVPLAQLVNPLKTSADSLPRLDRASTKPLQPVPTDDPDLARLLAAWPALPDPIRRAMLA